LLTDVTSNIRQTSVCAIFGKKKKSDPGVFVHYLGVVVSKNEQDRVSLNFNPAFEKIKNSL